MDPSGAHSGVRTDSPRRDISAKSLKPDTRHTDAQHRGVHGRREGGSGSLAADSATHRQEGPRATTGAEQTY